MRRAVLRVTFALGLGFGLAGLATRPVLAVDSKPKPPDWSGFTFVADVVGEVVKADDKSIKLRVTWFEPQVKGGNNNNNRRPNLSANNRNFHNPYHPTTRPPQVQFKEQHHDYDLEFVPQSLVRTKSLPPKTDDKGKRVQHTQKEIDELRTPGGVTGYASSASELVPGTIVEVILIRDKTIPAAKATEDDLRVKYAIILGKDPNPPKDIASPKPEPKKKN